MVRSETVFARSLEDELSPANAYPAVKLVQSYFSRGLVRQTSRPRTSNAPVDEQRDEEDQQRAGGGVVHALAYRVYKCDGHGGRRI